MSNWKRFKQLLMKNREIMKLQNGDYIEIYSENNSDNLKTTIGGIQFRIEEGRWQPDYYTPYEARSNRISKIN